MSDIRTQRSGCCMIAVASLLTKIQIAGMEQCLSPRTPHTESLFSCPCRLDFVILPHSNTYGCDGHRLRVGTGCVSMRSSQYGVSRVETSPQHTVDPGVASTGISINPSSGNAAIPLVVLGMLKFSSPAGQNGKAIKVVERKSRPSDRR